MWRWDTKWRVARFRHILSTIIKPFFQEWHVLYYYYSSVIKITRGTVGFIYIFLWKRFWFCFRILNFILNYFQMFETVEIFRRRAIFCTVSTSFLCLLYRKHLASTDVIHILKHGRRKILKCISKLFQYNDENRNLYINTKITIYLYKLR